MGRRVRIRAIGPEKITIEKSSTTRRANEYMVLLSLYLIG
jgi:hypothetical protein